MPRNTKIKQIHAGEEATWEKADIRHHIKKLFADAEVNTVVRAGRLQRKLQAGYNRQNELLNDALLRTMKSAASDEDAPTAPLYLVPAPTGSGKSLGVSGLIAAITHIDQRYSVAILSATIIEAQEIFNRLSKMVSASSIAIFTSAHEQDDADLIELKYGRKVADHVRKFGPSTREDAANAQIVISTHERWLADTRKGNGIHFYEGRIRDNVIVDELPAIVKVQRARPSDMRSLLEFLDPEKWLSLRLAIDGIVERMDEALSDGGATYVGVAGLAPAEILPDIAKLRKVLDHNGKHYERISSALQFLECAARGNCFLKQKGAHEEGTVGRPRSEFISYGLELKRHRGIIILDATAEFSELRHWQNIVVVKTPQVSYRNLRIVQTELPKQFLYAATEGRRDTSTNYVSWMSTFANSQLDEDSSSLIVTHKVFSEAKLRSKNSRLRSQDIRGHASVAYWGNGIGMNSWRDKGNVFLFGQYHIGREQHVAEYALLRGKSIAVAIRQIQSPSKEFRDLQVGHLLRWQKQMACRGNVRNISADGECGSMTLFTTMERGMLQEHFLKLFPGAQEPTYLASDNGTVGFRANRLADYLLQQDWSRRPEIPAIEVARAINAQVKQLRAIFNSKSGHFVRQQYKLISLGTKLAVTRAS